MRWALLTCASLSVAAHALTVSLLPAEEQPRRRPGGPAATAPAWRLRVISADNLSPKTAVTATPLTASSATSSQEARADLTTASASPADTGEQAPTTAEQTEDLTSPDAAPPLAALPTTEAPKTAEPATSPVDWQGDSQYIPRPQLSLPPVPETPVIVQPPKGAYDVGRITGILSLYIDEHGQVHHIASSGSPMPPEFEKAARQAFQSLTFRPGVLNGESVKSRIRVEVVFDNTPLTENAPQAPATSASR